MKIDFWQKLKEPLDGTRGKPFFVLAPMADVTDWPFRQIVASIGRPDVFYTEFVSADGLSSEKGKAKLLPLLYFTEEERPIVAQIFGSRPANIHKTAQLVQELGFDGLDINMGCPDRKVLKQGAGIALSKTPKLAKEIIDAAKEGAPNLPISIKTRLGYQTIDMKWIQAILDAKISALAVHLRTMEELSKVPAHWEIMPEVATMAKDYGAVSIGNGDILSREDGLNKIQETGMDGAMIGRGIFHNPWIFSYRGLASIQSVDNSEVSERLGLLKRHTEIFVEFWSRPPFSSVRMGRNFDTLKKFYKMYCAGFDGAAELRAKLMDCRQPEEVFAILQTKFENAILER